MNSVQGIDLLVISVACHSAINRKIYKIFSDEGFSVEILVPASIELSGGKFSADPAKKGDPIIHTGILIGSNSRIQLFSNQFQLLSEKKPKCILLDNDPITLNAVILGIWCYLNGSKLCCITCENLPIGVMENIRRKGLRSIFSSSLKVFFSKVVALLVNTVFTINDAGTQIFKELKFGNVTQMPLGFDPQIFHIDQVARKLIRSKLNVDKFMVGFFGRVTEEKGILILLEALSRTRDLDWVLLMDEFIHYKSNFSDVVEGYIKQLNLADRIIYANPTHLEMGQYINSVDLVIVPSISTKKWVEQYGRVAAESLACGKLVLASNSGYLPALLGGVGIVFEEGDVEELAALIRKVIGDKTTRAYPLDPESIAEYAKEKLSIYRQSFIMRSSLFH